MTVEDILEIRRMLNPRVARYDVGWSRGWAVYWHGEFQEWYADWNEAISAALSMPDRIGFAAKLRAVQTTCA